MTGPFPKSPEFSASFEPGRFEGGIYDLEVREGSIPRELNGTFYRVGPDPAFPPFIDKDIFFNGDGAVSAFRFEDGHVDFTRRYVRTEKFIAEREARRALIGRYRNAYTDAREIAGKCRTTANTNVIFHNGVLFALKEDSRPYALDPNTLETIGLWDFGGKLTSLTFTAHPKIDPRTGAMMCFGYEAKGDGSRDIVYYEIDAAGQVTREVWIVAPYAAMTHDFAVTEKYVIFPLMPLTVDVERLKQGGAHFQWQPTFDQLFGVLPRDGEARDVRWFRAPNGFQGHTLNAFDEGSTVYFDMPVATGNVFDFFPDARGYAPPPETITSPMTRWKFDMASNTDRLQATTLLQMGVEFPRCDERYVGSPHRHGIVLAQDWSKPYNAEKAGPIPPFFFNSIAHLDIATGKHETWFAGDTASVQEPIFVPKSESAGEGDGYVIALVNQLVERTNDIVILDALHLGEGPVAVIHLPVHHRMGLHGNWVPAEKIPATPAAAGNGHA